MSTHKHIDKVCLVAALLAVLLCVLFMNGEALGIQQASKVMGYESRLFDTSKVHTIDIVMEDWDSFIETCENEEYALCSVTIDGEPYHDVGIRAKGNTSLSSVSSMGSDRYSFKIEFDQYDSTKSYHGLDKLSLNNLIQDNTMMKDYLTYQMMGEFGAASPLCSYVYITVNGEDWGLYLAVEAVEDSFLQRNYGRDYGELYKPDSMNFGGGRGNGKDFNMEDFDFSQLEDFRGQDRTEKQSSAGTGGEALSDRGSRSPFQMQGMTPAGTSGGTTGRPGNFDPSAMPQGNGTQNPQGFDPSAMPQGNGTQNPQGFDPSAMPQGGGTQNPQGFDPSAMPQGGGTQNPQGFDPSAMPQGGGTQNPQGFDPSAMFGQGGTELPENFDPSAMPQQGGMQMPDGFDPSSLFGQGGMPGGFGGMGGGETKLQYSDDDPASYSTIFSSAKTDVTEADQKRLIQSLKTLSTGENIDSVVDVDRVLRYFVVHNFVVNGDSYTGSMVHNYYLYEEDGKLSMLPWDYNLAFGTFLGGSANSAVNDPIDTPLSVSGSGDRPMADWIFSNEEYTQMYHRYFAEFLEQMDFGAMIDETAALIAPYVEKDPSKFCTTEGFEQGVATLREFCLLREESVLGQLEGTIPSTDAGQSGNNAALVDASHLTLSQMGSMGMGMGGGREFPSRDTSSGETAQTPGTEGAADTPAGNILSGQMTPPTDRGSFPASANRGNEPTSPEGTNNQAPAQGDKFGTPDRTSPTASPASAQSTMILLAASVAVLLAGLIIAKKYRH